ncbi:hypothetical protein GWC95_02045 [Sediminibacterium roseum]|uniref:CHAT domain-containing protein n=1 Tax=Sediminibacterium roseum TaxID=1978412 RepID=A0ABW9ZRL3_9BACT|nr:hypothetical protein [Sediminibacterium roseum]NCI48688.1 hypothetical protein [Sediminibacterium roseum]
MKRIYTTALAVFMVLALAAQQEIKMPVIPASREYHHEQIISSLNAITKLARKTDTLFPVTGNKTLDQSINKAVRLRVNNMRAQVELNSKLDEKGKFTWLRGINEMLVAFGSAYRNHVLSASMLPPLVKAFEDAMQAQLSGNSILPVVTANEPEVGNILMDNFALRENEGIPAARDVIVLKSIQRNPNQVLQILTKHPNNRFADSLIIREAFKNQEDLSRYAAAPNALGRRIQSVNHPLVKIIGKLALTKTGRMYFPFLDNLYTGKITMDSITPYVKNDSSVGYYRLLVRTRIEYAERMHRGDTPMAVQALTVKLKQKAVDLFINEINALHDISNEKIRFKKLEGLRPEELYYLAVLGEDEIYTSSFVSGVYKKIFESMDVPRSDSLLDRVHNDYYKKFIKMCAAYNTLDNFLSRMSATTSEGLLRSFVDGLEKGATLEDAVDVADSYASIYNKDIRKLILTEVQTNLDQTSRTQNKRGQLIYKLLNTIFQSMDSTKHIDMTAELGIDPVYIMPKKALQDTSNRIIIQQFSYGDKDAATYFAAFMSRFRNANWKIKTTPQWVEISSVGKNTTPVTIYANLPLDEKQELDIQAQDALIDYLEANNLEPKIVIHRGHSYYLNGTISRLPSSAKLVLLGSCGGYQKLNDILKICPTAQIISSKQTGAGVVNQIIIDAITERLRLGKDLVWEDIWKNVSIKVGAGYREKFDDYIPPHKNLGAIFIMAYDNAWRGGTR